MIHKQTNNVQNKSQGVNTVNSTVLSVLFSLVASIVTGGVAVFALIPSSFGSTLRHTGRWSQSIAKLAELTQAPSRWMV